MIQLYQTLDLRPIGIPQTLRLSQYDSDFEIIFELTNFDGTWILDTNTTAEVQGTKTDGHGYSADAVFDDQLKTVTIAGDVQMTAAAGRNVYEVVLFHDGDRLGSKNFILDVERAALDAETTASDSKIKNFTAMTEAAEAAAETATAAAEAAEQAAASIDVTTKQVLDETSDMVIADGNGNVIMELADGHIATKYFDSRVNGNVVAKDTTDTAGTLYLADADGYVHTAINKGHLQRSEYVGKRISILGDSMSTFSGFSPSTWTPYYPSTASGVDVLDKMWYAIAAECIGAKLLTSASWGGSQVCGNSQGSDGAAMCSTARIEALTKNGIEPDMIIIFAGTNDWFSNRQIGSFDSASELPSEGNITTFSEAYALMMHKIMTRYPQAMVFCGAISARISSHDQAFPIKNTNGDTLAQFNDVIRRTARMFSARIIDFDACGITPYNTATYTVDGLHPNASGQALLGNMAINGILY